jgi:hypothetical protein
MVLFIIQFREEIIQFMLILSYSKRGATLTSAEKILLQKREWQVDHRWLTTATTWPCQFLWVSVQGLLTFNSNLFTWVVPNPAATWEVLVTEGLARDSAILMYQDPAASGVARAVTSVCQPGRWHRDAASSPEWTLGLQKEMCRIRWEYSSMSWPSGNACYIEKLMGGLVCYISL